MFKRDAIINVIFLLTIAFGPVVILVIWALFIIPQIGFFVTGLLAGSGFLISARIKSLKIMRDSDSLSAQGIFAVKRLYLIGWLSMAIAFISAITIAIHYCRRCLWI